MSGYSRDRFPHWASQGDGCDTRDVVLQRDGAGRADRRPAARSPPGDVVQRLRRRDASTDPGDIDIDHMVPLANAWRTGAASWTDEQREEFANDLSRPQLIAVTRVDEPVQGRPGPVRSGGHRGSDVLVRVRPVVDRREERTGSSRVTVAEKAALAEMLGTAVDMSGHDAAVDATSWRRRAVS